MIYTIGHKKSYERYFHEQGTPEKMGRKYNDSGRCTYSGGSVWKTKEEAQKYCHAKYSVYGVEADWEKDTEKSETGKWHDLLKTSPLVKINT